MVGERGTKQTVPSIPILKYLYFMYFNYPDNFGWAHSGWDKTQFDYARAELEHFDPPTLSATDKVKDSSLTN